MTSINPIKVTRPVSAKVASAVKQLAEASSKKVNACDITDVLELKNTTIIKGINEAGEIETKIFKLGEGVKFWQTITPQAKGKPKIVGVDYETIKSTSANHTKKIIRTSANGLPKSKIVAYETLNKPITAGGMVSVVDETGSIFYDINGQPYRILQTIQHKQDGASIFDMITLEPSQGKAVRVLKASLGEGIDPELNPTFKTDYPKESFFEQAKVFVQNLEDKFLKATMKCFKHFDK